ncbi:MAG TPA: TetR/AcrR family transcriptional regulator [Actinomycetota bacterium]|nr:TetR/AcrR family transcriptional regulator [Actinomycetota bacterium]
MAAQETRRRSQPERSEATQRALVESARQLFASEGYPETQLDDVVRAAGVTKGALYHHFQGKADLFGAVFEHEQRRLAKVVSEAYHRQREPWKGFFAGCRALLEANLDPGTQRITLLDAPSVLGWEQMREIQSKYCLRLVKEGLQQAIAEGQIASRPIEPIAHLVVGAIFEGSMMVARADDQRAAAKRLLAELRTLLDAFRVPQESKAS